MVWLLLLLIIILLAGVWGMLLRQSKKPQGAAPPLSEVLPEGIEARPKMLFYFYSEHCGHCRRVTPLVEALEKEQPGVVKVDVRRQLATARRFGVKGTPTLFRVDHGNISGVHVGEINHQRLRQFFFD